MKQLKHKDRKSYKVWKLKDQLIAPVTSFEHIKVTASVGGAFNRILQKHGIVKSI